MTMEALGRRFQGSSRLGPLALVTFLLHCGGLAQTGAGGAGDSGAEDAGSADEAATTQRDGRSGLGPPDASAADGSAEEESDSTCADRLAIWKKAVAAPIRPGLGAALLMGVDTHGALTLAQAEAVLCLGVDQDAGSDDASLDMSAMGWGITAPMYDGEPIQLDYDAKTGVGYFLRLVLGYTGALDFTSDPTSGSTHTYHVVVGQQVQRDGNPWEIDWTDPNLAALMEIYNGVLYTFEGPSVYRKPPTGGCQSDGSCVVVTPAMAASYGGQAIFGVVPLGLYLRFTAPTALQPTVSTLAGIDLTITWPAGTVPP